TRRAILSMLLEDDMAVTDVAEPFEISLAASDQSNYDRLCMLDAGRFMIDERPLFGIGLEMVEERYPIYRHPTAPQAQVPHLHNSFLQRAAEQGLIGLAAYLAMMAGALFLGLRGLRREGIDGPRGDLYLALVLILVAFNVASLFEDNWRDTEVRRLLLFCFAMPLCLERWRDPDRSA
ncbi:MAG: O-antigen ligase family protein, partial [Acidobacteriota bacterium]